MAKGKPDYERQDNSNQEHASDAELRKAAKSNTLTEERVDVGGRKVSAEARDPSKVKGVAATFGLAPGSAVSVTLESGRTVPATVYQVHPGRAANEDLGIAEEQPTLDVVAFTGNPDTGGREHLFGVPVASVTADATLR